MEAKKFDQFKTAGESVQPEVKRKKESIMKMIVRLFVAPDLDLETYRRLEGLDREERRIPCHSRWGLL